MAESGVDTKFCNNCKKQISANNFVMHEMHCRRHITLCEHCNEPIPKGEMEVHFEETHGSIACPKCGVEVEKQHLEHHEETSCAKKPMKCVYCELEFPKAEFNAHIDYCGSRTEPCVKCGQYIKLRDQTKHEESKCTFPQVKPVNNNQNDGGLGRTQGVMGNEFGEGRMNSFTFNEMSRVLGMERSPEESRVPYSRLPLEENGAVNRNKARLNNAVVKNKKKVNGKSDVNKKRDGVVNVSPSGRESEYDRMLAMHLAQDLNPEDDLEGYMHGLDKPATSPIVYSTRGNTDSLNTFSQDSIMIPCEFCDIPFDADELVQHQSGCSLDRISSMLPQMTSTLNNQTEMTNNIGRQVEPSLVDPPAIINNLRSNLTDFDQNEWLDDTAAGEGLDNGDEYMMLPCEFCNDPFPMEALIQHQAICESNTTQTPRVMSPAETRTKPKTKSSFTNAHRLTSEFPNLTSNHNSRPTPATMFAHDDIADENNRPTNYKFGATHKVQKPKSSSTSNDVGSKVTAPGNIRATLRKYGVESADRGDYYTRQGGSHLRSPESISPDPWLKSPSTQVTKKTTGTGSRTRSTLDNLLNNTDDNSSHDLLGHIGGSRGQKTEINGSGTRQRSLASNPAVTRGKPKLTPAPRDIPREVTRTSTRTNNPLQPKTRTAAKPNFELRPRQSEMSDDNPSVLPSQRQRSRANVFGASSTSSIKPTTRRRSENQ